MRQLNNSWRKHTISWVIKPSQGPWRDVYLSAAKELRFGKSDETLDPSLMAGILQEAPTEYFLDALSVNLDGEAAEGADYVFNFNLIDTGECLSNSKQRVSL